MLKPPSPRTRAIDRRIKAVFFDFDGVLTTDTTGSITTCCYLSKETGIDFAVLRDAFAEHNAALNLGKTTYAAIWPTVCDKLGVQIDIALLSAAFASTPFNAGMLQLAARLRQRCCVGIITDNKSDRMDYLKAHTGLSTMFDPIVVSAEVGFDKSSPRIFEKALDIVSAAAEDTVFIDNTASNLVVPDALGMNTVCFDEQKNDIEGLAAMLRQTYALEIAGSS